MTSLVPAPVIQGRCRPWPQCARLEAGSMDTDASTPLPILAFRAAPAMAGFASLTPAASPFGAAPADTGRQELFEYSDAYATRLTIHRIASYATLPLFLAQVVTGEVLLRDRSNPPGWAKSAHKPIAFGLAGLFAVNTVTGGLNALEVRRDPDADSRTTIHTLLMLIADAGFVFTGVTVESAGTVGPLGRIRTKHRKAALISMGFATVGYAIMLPPFRKD